jgi:putative copper resistance protein D
MGMPAPARGRVQRALVAAALACLVLFVTYAAAGWTGAGGDDIPGLPAAGDLVRHAGPTLRGLALGAATAATALLLLLVVLRPHTRDGRLEAPARRLMRGAGAAFTGWAVVAALQSLVAASDLLALPPPALASSALYDDALFASAAVRGPLIVGVLALVAAWICLSASRLPAAGAALALALLAGVQPALSGHASGASQHALLLPTTTVHAASALIWTGMTAAVWLAVGSAHAPSAASWLAQRRVSTAAAALVVVSGVGNGAAQLSSPDDLISTRYGQMILVKAAMMALALVLGLTLAARLARAGGTGRGPLVLRAGAETAALIATMGVGAVLALSAPPRRPVPLPTAGERAAGFAFPPAPSWHEVVVELRPDALFLAVCLLLASLYASGLIRLHRRGDRWPPGRSISWFGGVAMLAWLTNFGISQYANVAAGFHMIQHMVLTMLVPILLVLGAPATLALRALSPSTTPRWGAREWVVSFLASRPLQVLTNPAVVLVLYFAGLYGLYLTSAFATLMSSHAGHVFMQAHFVVSGFLFYWILIGVDPRPRPLPYLYRFMIMVIASALHGFFAVVIMMSGAPLAPEWFGLVRPPWIDDLLTDTVNGGQAAWAMGEFPLAVVAITLAVQWARQEDRAARRADRRALQTGDVDRRLYNAYLSDLSTGRRRGPGRPAAGAKHEGPVKEGPETPMTP